MKERPSGQEFLKLKDIISKSDYKSLLTKYSALAQNLNSDPFNQKDENYMLTRYTSNAAGYVDKSGLNDQFLYDNEYTVIGEDVYKLKGFHTKLLNVELFEELFNYGFDVNE